MRTLGGMRKQLPQFAHLTYSSSWLPSRKGGFRACVRSGTRTFVLAALLFVMADLAMETLISTTLSSFTPPRLSSALNPQRHQRRDGRRSRLVVEGRPMTVAAEVVRGPSAAKREYGVAGIINESSNRVTDLVASFTGNDKYQFGDISKEAVVRFGDCVKSFTGKEEYRFGDITKTIVRKVVGRRTATPRARTSDNVVEMEGRPIV